MTYLEKPKDSTKKTIGIGNELSKVTGYKINLQKSVPLYMLTVKKLKGNQESNSTYNSYKKFKIPRKKFYQRHKKSLQGKL